MDLESFLYFPPPLELDFLRIICHMHTTPAVRPLPKLINSSSNTNRPPPIPFTTLRSKPRCVHWLVDARWANNSAAGGSDAEVKEPGGRGERTKGDYGFFERCVSFSAVSTEFSYRLSLSTYVDKSPRRPMQSRLPHRAPHATSPRNLLLTTQAQNSQFTQTHAFQCSSIPPPAPPPSQP